MLVATATGWVLQLTGSYQLIFAIAGSLYLIALLIVHLLVPEVKPVRLDGVIARTR
jgi:MFS transporter, ACS family, aldohexuronate transporter